MAVRTGLLVAAVDDDRSIGADFAGDIGLVDADVVLVIELEPADLYLCDFGRQRLLPSSDAAVKNVRFAASPAYSRATYARPGKDVVS